MASQFAMIRVRGESRHVFTRTVLNEAAGVNFNEFAKVLKNGFKIRTSKLERVDQLPSLCKLMCIAPNGTYIISHKTRAGFGNHVVVVQKRANNDYVCVDNGHTFSKTPKSVKTLPNVLCSRGIRVLPNEDAYIHFEKEPVTMAARKTKPRNRQSGLKPFVRKTLKRRKKITAEEMHDLAIQEGIESPITSIRSSMWQVRKEMESVLTPTPARGRAPVSTPGKKRKPADKPVAEETPEIPLHRREVKRKERKGTLKFLVKQTLKEEGNQTISAEDMQEVAKKNGFDSPLSSIRSVLWNVRKDEGIEITNGRGAGLDPEKEEPTLPEETEEERNIRISKRFATLERLSVRLMENKIPAMIVSGPPGLGKTYTLEQKVMIARSMGRKATVISGTISPVGLYRTLYEHADGGVIILDDCDDVFRDDTCLNLLKAVLDSSSQRIVSYMKDAKWMKEDEIPQSFEFCGSVAFCTNIDFEREVQRNHMKSIHYKALMDRSLYLTLTLRGRDDCMTRIRQVADDEIIPAKEEGDADTVNPGLLRQMGLDVDQAKTVMDYVVENQDRCYSLSIRFLLQVANCMVASPNTWREDADATQLRTI